MTPTETRPLPLVTRAIAATIPADFAEKRALCRTLEQIARRGEVQIPEIQRQSWEHLGVIVEYCLTDEHGDMPDWAIQARDIFTGRLNYQDFQPKDRAPQQACTLDL